jgi:2-polyprenyl-6-hydroxyphenyl methylase/3-demethylubiquinone-9 3-methyltransferase
VQLLREALHVTRPGGTILLSSYAERFWPHRYHWFELQAERGLIGEIDTGATRNGVIVCKDGFRAGAMSADDFRGLCSRLGQRPTIQEVDGSSLFCEVKVPTGVH